MIMGLYALVPIIRKLISSDQDQKTEKYFLTIGFIMGFLLPRTMDFLFSWPITSNLFFLPKLHEIINTIDFRFGAGYVYYFVLGHYLSTLNINHNTRRLSYFTGFICIAATAFLTQWHSECIGAPSQKYYNNFTLPVHFIAVSAFIFCKYTLSKVHVGDCAQKAVAYISKCCFGVYLVHLWIINNIHQIFSWHAGTFHPIPNVFVLSLAVFSISFLISAVIHKMPILKKYIV